MKIALQVHPTRISDEMLAAEIRPVLAGAGCEYYQLPRGHQGQVALEPDTGLILALGGDGTFLHGARVAAAHEVPIFGVIVGRLGFLCSATLADMPEALSAIIAGRMPMEERHVLLGQVLAGEAVRFEEVALNDIVVFRAETEKLRDLEAYDNGELIARYRADGIILSTAVGSTAYNMSAGGPLVHPSMELIVLTPICAHSLFTKPLVLPPTNRVEIVGCTGSYPLTVSFDGSSLWRLEEGDRVAARSYGKRLKIYRPERYDFYQVLRHKFQHGYVYGEDQA